MSRISELDRRRMDELTQGLPSKSAKMRRLAAEGYSKGDIARYLDVRYQFVYNVLSAAASRTVTEPESQAAELLLAAPSTSAAGTGQGRPESSNEATKYRWTTVRKGGTIEFPAAFLQAMGIGEGDQVQLVLEGRVVRVLNRNAALREVQEHVQRYVPEGVSLVDELLAERRAETAREMEGN